MEDFIEIIFWILAAVASIAGSIYKSQRKRKAEREKRVNPTKEEPYSNEENTNPFPGFPPIFEEMQEVDSSEDENEPEYSFEEEEIETIDNNEDEAFVSSDEGNAVFQSTHQTLISDGLRNSTVEEMSMAMSEIGDNDITKIVTEEPEFEFEPIKAVIYSEILGTKKY